MYYESMIDSCSAYSCELNEPEISWQETIFLLSLTHFCQLQQQYQGMVFLVPQVHNEMPLR